MSPSEFPIGISAVAPSQFGGGQSYFGERQTNLVKIDERPAHQHPNPDETDEPEEEAENPESEAEQEPKKETGFEPTYDLSKGVEHHTHVGLLLDVKL